MAKWSEYKLKETPASEDELMSYDIAGKANKRTTVGNVANNTAFSELKTDSKTLVGGINEVNEEKANGKGISFSINESGGLRVTYDDGK